MKDLTGQIFGRWRVVKFSGVNKWRTSVWLCECECGTTKEVNSAALKNGSSKSCGCLSSELSRTRFTTHGRSKSKTYKTYLYMKSRCTNSKDTSYAYYGGRGIKVCEAWLESFEQFYGDMGEIPKEGYSLDRIDTNGDYSADNCRWVDISTQKINVRMSPLNKTGIVGVHWHKQSSKWVSVIVINKTSTHLGSFSNFFEACCARKSAEAKSKYSDIYLNKPTN